MKSLSKWFVVLMIPFAMSLMAIGSLSMSGCTGAKGVDSDAEPNAGVPDDEYEKMMNEGNEKAKQNAQQ